MARWLRAVKTYDEMYWTLNNRLGNFNGLSLLHVLLI